MKIWIIGAVDILPLFKILNKFAHHYILYFDQNWWAYGDKELEFVVNRVNKAIDILQASNVDFIILQPTLEIYFRYTLGQENILPLGEKYFLKGLKFSLVGKIWFAGDWLDKQYFQSIFRKYILPKYTLTDNQKNIKKFNKNFPMWVKHTSMWKYYLTTFWYRDWMVRKTIKTDLKYFKDADVDTFFVLNWGYLAYDNLFRKYLKYKRIRHQWVNVLEEVFEGFNLPTNTYNVEIIFDWPDYLLTSQKRFLYLLQKGKEINLKIKKI